MCEYNSICVCVCVVVQILAINMKCVELSSKCFEGWQVRKMMDKVRLMGGWRTAYITFLRYPFNLKF